MRVQDILPIFCLHKLIPKQKSMYEQNFTIKIQDRMVAKPGWTGQVRVYVLANFWPDTA